MRRDRKRLDWPFNIWLPAVRAGSGVDVFVERLAEALEEAGHHPRVQWFASRFEFIPWLLRGIRAPDQVDIVHASSWNAFAFKRPGIPLVVNEHHFVGDSEFQPFRTPGQALYHRALIYPMVQRSYRKADRIVAVSRHTASAIRRTTGLDAEVIYNWVDLDRFKPNRTARDSSARRFRLLVVGNPSRRKGTDLLAPLARMLGRDFEIQWVSGLRGARTRVYHVSNLQDLGRVEPRDMPAIYRDADAVLALSRYEAFGFATLEALACGCPVVGFNSTGTAEICVDGKTGLLVPVDDLESLLRAIRRLRDDIDLHERMSVEARKRAEQFSSKRNATNAYLNVYRSVMESRRN